MEKEIVNSYLEIDIKKYFYKRKDEVGHDNDCHSCKSWLWGRCRCKEMH